MCREKNVGVTDMKIHLTRIIARVPRNHSQSSQCECTCQFLCSPVVALLLALPVDVIDDDALTLLPCSVCAPSKNCL